MRSGMDLIVISLEPWDDVWRRNQYLIDGLLRADDSLRVLFVEPPRDPLHDLVHRRGARKGSGLREAAGYEGRLTLLQPTKALPRFAGGAADALMRSEVRRVVRMQGMRNPVLWVNDAHGAGLVSRTGWPALYDITDDWLAAERPQRELDRLLRNEDTLLALCRKVVVCSPALAASRGAKRPVLLVPNAVDVARYRAPTDRPGDLPSGRVALYMGTLHEDRLDVDLLVRTARRLPPQQASIVLVGPDALATSRRAALREAGVHILGPRGRAAVPGYLQHADTLIVPHIVDAFTDSLDPIKLYEYRAVGRPIVSTPVAGFRELAGAGVAVAEGDDFAAAVVASVTAESPTQFPEDVPDWSERVAQMGQILAQLRA